MTPQFKYPGMKVYYVQIKPHDMFWFSSFDIGAVSQTEPIVHNFALSYAVSQFNRVISHSSVPTYEEDLEKMDWYASPAKAIQYAKTALTWNAINTNTQTTEDPTLEKANTPKFGKRHVLLPWPATVFEAYLFSKSGQRPPRVIRLGKKRAVCVLESEEIRTDSMRVWEEFRPTHLVNPLDVMGEIASYRPITIMPSLLVDEASILNNMAIRDGKHFVLVPKRLLKEN